MYVPRNKKRNFVVVPWYNRHEWEKTYRNLFSDSLKDQAAGLGVVAAWRSRLYGHLPRAIESTAALVQAQLSESRSRLHNDSLNAEELSCLYAVAIVRFVGDIVEPVRSVKNITTKEAAFQLGVPDWILELRHASAHASVSGAAFLGILRSAASLLLQWLRLHHWEPQRDTLVAPEASAMLCSKNGNDAELACCSPTQVRQILDAWLLVSVKQKRKCTRREMAELKVKRQACLDQIAACLEEDSDLVVDMLVLGGDYLLPSRESLDELCPNMRAGNGSDRNSSPSQLNVIRLLKAAMDYPMEYSTKAITVLSQHMWPPLGEAELGHLTALAAIQGGLMLGHRWDTMDSAEEDTGGDGSYMPYTVEDFQDAEDGFDETAWKLPQTSMEWSLTPVGQLPGFPADRLDLNLDFKELRPVGAARLEDTGLSLEQASAEASVNTEETELPTLADQLDRIRQNLQLFLV
ncbi:uncharacterized protein LOC119173573 isoform X6 [Rhipicephalus microplus]|uniref:uncharacterized protein LOC119173573 isoform X6 n=1 Tax=Rhipicephalus microplus TaxID=6941 RepID=UPI003F6CB978